MVRFELANKIRNGRTVGNLYLVLDRGPEGRHCNVLGKFETTQERDQFVAAKGLTVTPW